MIDIQLALALMAAAFTAGAVLGFGVRAYVSARRRRDWRNRTYGLPALHDSPFLAPDGKEHEPERPTRVERH
jgi:hypothetical protein